MENLRDQHIIELRAIFDLFDTDKHDGHITKEEMQRFLNQIGIYPSNVEVEEMFSMFDQSGNGKIDYPEFVNLIAQ